MNTGSALAAIISPVIGGYLIQKTGNWMLPFIVSMGVILVGSALDRTVNSMLKAELCSLPLRHEPMAKRRTAYTDLGGEDGERFRAADSCSRSMPT